MLSVKTNNGRASALPFSLVSFWHFSILIFMTEKRKLGDVFKTVGLPPYTYVKPKYFGEVRADIEQSGKHLLIEGPSGIGKTCVVFKVFE